MHHTRNDDEENCQAGNAVALAFGEQRGRGLLCVRGRGWRICRHLGSSFLRARAAAAHVKHHGVFRFAPAILFAKPNCVKPALLAASMTVSTVPYFTVGAALMMMSSALPNCWK